MIAVTDQGDLVAGFRLSLPSRHVLSPMLSGHEVDVDDTLVSRSWPLRISMSEASIRCLQSPQVRLLRTPGTAGTYGRD